MPFDFHHDGSGDAQLCFDFDVAVAPPRSDGARESEARRTNYYAGLSAEHTAERHYRRRGARVLERRWRGPGGEIDLILSEGARVVFVEVKKSKTHAQAAQRVTRRQMARILASAEAYLDQCPNGSLTEVRVDVALVDRHGALDIIENACLAA